MDLANYYNLNSQAEAAMSRITQESGADLLQKKNEAGSRDVVARLNERDAEDHINQAFNAVDEGIIMKGLTGKGSTFIKDKMSENVNNYIVKPVKGKLVNYAKGTDSLTEDLRNLPENLKTGIKGIGQQISDNVETYGQGLRDVASKVSAVADQVGDDASSAISKTVERTGIQRVMPQIRRLGHGLKMRLQQAQSGQSRGMNVSRDIREVGDPDQADFLDSQNPFDPVENPPSTGADAGNVVNDLGDSGGSVFDSPAKLILPDDNGSINAVDDGVRQITSYLPGEGIEMKPLGYRADTLPSHLGGGSTQYGTAGDAVKSVEASASKGGVADGSQVAEEDAGSYIDRMGGFKNDIFDQIERTQDIAKAKSVAKSAAEAGEEATQGLDEALTEGAGNVGLSTATDASKAAEEATQGLGRTIGKAVMKKAAEQATKTAIDGAANSASDAADAAAAIADSIDAGVDAIDTAGAVADVATAAIPGADLITDLGTFAAAGAGFGIEKLADWIEKKTSGPDDTAADVVGAVMRTQLGATQTHLEQ